MRKRLAYLLLVVAVVALDQLTKWLVLRALAIHDFKPVIDGLLSLSHVRNRGAAFGILSEADLPHQGIVFSIVSVLALAAIAVYSLRTPPESRLPQVALSLVMGGAIGNLIDRIRFGYVIDFVHVYWKTFQWWDFNLADSCISIGVCLLVLDVIRSPGRDGAPKSTLGETPSLAGRTE